jgi:hypothetical protein
MVFLFRRLIKQLILTALIGFVIRKALASKNPRVQQTAQQANRLLGGFVGLDETGNRVSRRRAMGRSARGAVVGGALSYFFDPQHGSERRARVKTFASERLRRDQQPLALPDGRYNAGPSVERAAPRAVSG